MHQLVANVESESSTEVIARCQTGVGFNSEAVII
jgi:hypothetical protein